jgi:WD40 repeat protein
MTRSKHFKALVRARVARTGERYTVARDRLLAELEAVRIEAVTTIEAHDKHCIAVRFTPDGGELLTGGFGGQARIWSTRDWSRAGELIGHSQSVNGFGLDAAGGAVTVSSDGTVRLWDVPTRRERGVLVASGKVGLGVDIRSDGRLAATGSVDGKVRFHDLAGDAPAGRGAAEPRQDARAPLKVGGRVTAVAFEPGGERLVVSTVGAGAVVVGADGSVAREIPFDPAINARWSPDGAFLLLTGGGGVVVVLETVDWTEVRRMETGLGGMLPVATSPDGGLVAIGWERHVGFWPALEDERVLTIDGLPKGVYALDFSPDGRLLAQGGADGRVRIWRVRAG